MRSMVAARFSFSWRALWRRLAELGQRTLRIRKSSPRSLCLRDSLPLGDRRFVAVVQFEQERFLIGGTSSSLVLLSRLADSCGGADGGGNCGVHGQVPDDEVQTPLNALWSGGATRGQRRDRC
jgi:hypothetical protein